MENQPGSLESLFESTVDYGKTSYELFKLVRFYIEYWYSNLAGGTVG